MDDFVISNLHEARNEWCSRLVSIFTPLVIEGIKSIFNESWKMCSDADELNKYLMTFQNFLSRIPKWNSVIIEEERKRKEKDEDDDNDEEDNDNDNDDDGDDGANKEEVPITSRAIQSSSPLLSNQRSSSALSDHHHHHGNQVIALFDFQNFVVVAHARGNQFGDTSFHDGFGFFWVFQLIADCHAITGFD